LPSSTVTTEPTTAEVTTVLPSRSPTTRTESGSTRQHTLPDASYKGTLSVLTTFTPTKSCKDYVLELNGRSETTKFPFIADECSTWLEIHESECNNEHSLTKEEMYALGLYTWDLSLNGTKEENFYYVLNNILRERKPDTFTAWSGFLYFLQSALKKFPDKKMTVYRGIPEISLVREKYMQGRKIFWSGYSSTTSDIQTAKEFATTQGVIMKISVLNGKDVKTCSAFSIENEILLSPNMKLFVSREMYQENGYNFIDLVQEDVSETFVF